MHDRLDRIRRQLHEHDLDALLVGPGTDLRWATGFVTHASERLTMLVVPADAEAVLVVPQLEAPLATTAGVDEFADLRAWDETTDPVGLVAEALPEGTSRIAVQDQLWTQFTLRLQARVSGATWLPGSVVTGPLRQVKDADEIAALHAVGAAIDEVHARVPDLLRPGRSEADVAADIEDVIRATHDAPAFGIVASGPNGASPHHLNSDRSLHAGDPVVVDIGGTLDGYHSDCTRNYVVGTVPDDYQQVHDLLQRAQAAATATVRPGVTAEQVDAAARDVIADGGHGDHFVHRTGHGIGLDVHEQPWIVAGNDLHLEVGMAFSVEPGIYVPGRFGARIEDIVIVTEDGVESVNHRPRTIVVA